MDELETGYDMASKKFFAITSLSHSGSTVFSMALACHNNLVSLGEIFQVLRQRPSYWLNDDEHLCSCGQPAAKCGFWGPALTRLQQDIPDIENPSSRYQHIPQAYDVLLDTFQSQFGEERRVVDTSKGTRHLKLIAEREELNPEVLLLLRDVRSFAYSQTRLAKRAKRKGLKKVKGHYWFQMLKWYFGNIKREKILKQNQVQYQKIGYEHFCFHTTDVLNELYDTLSLPPRSTTQSLAQAEHHILFGNPMRLSEKQAREVKYDSRWLKDSRYIVPAFLMPFVTRYNRKNVYQ